MHPKSDVAFCPGSGGGSGGGVGWGWGELLLYPRAATHILYGAVSGRQG